MDQKLISQFDSLLKAIDDAVDSHETRTPGPYPVAFLSQMRSELIAMRDEWPLHPFRFGRAIVDWPETELGKQILAFGQLFERSRIRHDDGS